MALIVQQAHQLGWDKPIVGSDSWGSVETVELCGKDCYGLFFSTHYAAAGATGATQEFIERYNAKYGYVPDDVAALTWDALGIVKQAIRIAARLPAISKLIVNVCATPWRKFKNLTGLPENDLHRRRRFRLSVL